MRDKILGRVNVFVPLIATVFVNVAIDEAVDEIETILQIEDLSLIILCSSIDKTIEK